MKDIHDKTKPSQMWDNSFKKLQVQRNIPIGSAKESTQGAKTRVADETKNTPFNSRVSSRLLRIIKKKKT